MRTSTRLAAFGAGLAAALAIGAGIGAAVGPAPTSAPPEAPAPVGEGVVSTADGYRLVPTTTTLEPAGGLFAFVITDPDGDAQRRFTPLHERDLHLIVVDRELTSYHHVHPRLGPGGTWSVRLPPLPPGSYRAVADFQVAGGPRLALGTDLAVAGAFRPGRLHPPSTRAEVDGYHVSLATERGPGGEVAAVLRVRRDGKLVTDLQPYLGASGHLVGLRAGDLAYAHVHPVAPRHGQAPHSSVRFDATLPAAGRYALFFDFKHDGTVHTAAFTFDQGMVAGTAEMGH